jgi:hypothetical protein
MSMHPSAVQNFKSAWVSTYIVPNGLFWLFLKARIDSSERLFLLLPGRRSLARERRLPVVFQTFLRNTWVK